MHSHSDRLVMEKSWKNHGKLLVMEKSWNSVGHGKVMENPNLDKFYFLDFVELRLCNTDLTTNNKGLSYETLSQI